MCFYSHSFSYSRTSLLILVILFMGILSSPVLSVDLVYSSYLGGSGGDFPQAIAIGQNGKVYIAGYTKSPDFPTTAAAYSTISSGLTDAFISEIDTNASGAASLVYSTFLGGSMNDEGLGIAIDGNGIAYITGYTNSTDFPVTTNAFSTTYIGAGHSEAFVTKLNINSSGTTALLYSSFLGGDGGDQGSAIAIDTGGNIYITGFTASSTTFPLTTNGFSTTYIGGGNNEAFVAKINPNLSGSSSLVYSTYLGGTRGDNGNAIALDNSGNVYVTGYTLSTTFPVTSNAISTTKIGQGKVFFSKLNTNLSGNASLLYSTYLGGSVREEGKGIAVDSSGNAYITGYTWSKNFPATTNAFNTTNSGAKVAFLSRIDTNSTGISGLIYSTSLGGTSGDQANAIAVDNSGKAYITGQTWSADFPVTANAFSTTYHGSFLNVIYSQLNTNSSGTACLEYSTYLAGTLGDVGYGIAVDTLSNAYITGLSFSTTFPVTTNAFCTTYIGGTNGMGFITRLGTATNPVLPGPTMAKLPDLKLYMNQGLNPAFNLSDFNTDGTATSFTFFNNFLGLGSLSDSTVSQDAFDASTTGINSYTANLPFGTTTVSNKVKYSTYKIQKLPQVVLRPGNSWDVNMGSLTNNLTNSLILPASYGNDSSLESSDTTQITATWANTSVVTITALAGFTSSQILYITAAPVATGYGTDIDKERMEIYPALSTTAFEFGNGTDTTVFGYQTPAGVSVLGSVGYETSINDPLGNPSHGGVLKLTFANPTAGIKVTPKFSTWLPNSPQTFYTLRVRVFGTSTINNFLELLYNGNPGVSPTDVEGYFKYSTPTVWTYYDIPVNSYSAVSSSPVMYPQLVVKGNGATGTVYIDEMEIFQATPPIMNDRYLTADRYVGGYWNDGNATTKWGLQVLAGTPAISVSSGQLIITTSGASTSQSGLKYTASTAAGKVYTVSAHEGYQVGMHIQTNFVSGTPSVTLTQAQVNLLGATGPGSGIQGGDIGAAAEIGRISPRTLQLAFFGHSGNYQVQFVIKSAGASTIHIDNTQADIDRDDPNYGDSTLFP